MIKKELNQAEEGIKIQQGNKMALKRETDVKALELIPEVNEVLSEEPRPEKSKDEQIEILQKQLEEANEKLSREPEDLACRIEYFKRKQELISKLNISTNYRDQLQKHLKTLDEITLENDFECDKYVLSLGTKGQYRDEAVFSMNNPVLIGEVVKHVIIQIDSKMECLRNEIAG